MWDTAYFDLIGKGLEIDYDILGTERPCQFRNSTDIRHADALK
jgi:hypothetical protein